MEHTTNNHLSSSGIIVPSLDLAFLGKQDNDNKAPFDARMSSLSMKPNRHVLGSVARTSKLLPVLWVNVALTMDKEQEVHSHTFPV